MLNNARDFLATVLPEPNEGGAYLNIHWSSPGDHGKIWTGRAASSVDEALKVVSWVSSLPDKNDIYVCMSLQAKREKKTSKAGRDYWKAMRLAEDVVAIRSLFVDLDVKAEAYPTTADAVAALKLFVTSSGMPMPSATVFSGTGGLHVHWALDQDLKREEWQVLANALAIATQKLGLITDSQCTIDSARILRVPNTHNHKVSPPAEVKLNHISARVSLEAVRAALAPYIGMTPPPAAARITANDDLGAGLMPVKTLAKIEELVKVCPFIARSYGTGGIDNNQPLWFATAGICAHVEEGRDAFHIMSDKHPGYSARDTDQMFDRVAGDQKRRDIGWPKCDKIALLGCKDCQTCPNLGQGKSPLHFVSQTPVTAPDATLPDKYVRNADGSISAKAVTEDGAQILLPVSHYPILNGWLSDNPWTFHFTTRNEQGRKSVIEIPTEVITAKDSFPKFMGMKGFFCTEMQYKVLKEFFVSWIQKLQNSKESVISAAPFGWSVVDGKIEGFTFAGRVWSQTGDRPAANPNPVLQYQYTPKGSDAPWRELASIIYGQQRPALDAILAVAFAGPLVRFTGFPGLIMNAYSPESGIGKTTAMKVSQSVWGHPVLAMQGLNDTSNSVLGKMGQIRSIPVYWDEIKSDAQVKRFCSIVFDLTGGREKSRMNADATLKLSGMWQTLMVSASNDSLVDGMAREVGSTTAGLHRLFEFAVEKPPQVSHDVGMVQRLAGRLEDNYGHAGLAYAKFLGTNWKRIEADVAAKQDELYSSHQMKQEERNWGATMAVVLMGAQYANELGLTQIDIPPLQDFLVKVLGSMREEVSKSPSDMTSDMSVSSVLAEFMGATRARNTLVTNRIWTSKGKPGTGAVQIKNDTSKLSEIYVHYGVDDKIMRISSTFFTRWMGERKYSRQTWVKRMEREFGLKVVNGKLGGGTEMVCAMEYLIEIDMNHPNLKVFIE